MATHPLGHARKRLGETDSTNRVALDWADAPNGALVTAHAQTAGRGRLGRSWESPAGKGLYFSLILRPGQIVPARFALLAGLGVARGIEGVSELQIQCKWPNDLLCHGRKIGGILCEARDERLVIGVGLNVTQTAEDLPARPIFPASSLLLESGATLPTETLLHAILRALEASLGSSNWRADYENRLYGRDEIARANGTIGVVSGVEDDGSLRLQTADGPRGIVAGDVERI